MKYSQHFYTAQSYLGYLSKAKNATYLHSPFVYELYQQVIATQKQYYAFEPLETLRQKLLNDATLIEVTDLGAGSKQLTHKKRAVSSIAKHSLSAPKQAQLLFKLVNYFQPKTIIETGTSLGLSSLYLALPNSQAKVFTLEGCPQIAQIAQQNFEAMEVKNIELVMGDISETLPETLRKIETLDFAFLDANHQQAPTIAYFEHCLSLAHQDTIFVIDDLYWSKEMQAAWQYIQQHPSVSLTIDLFVCGLVFLKKRPEKQHFILKF